MNRLLNGLRHLEFSVYRMYLLSRIGGLEAEKGEIASREDVLVGGDRYSSFDMGRIEAVRAHSISSSLLLIQAREDLNNVKEVLAGA